MTYMRHRGQPTSIIDVTAGWLVGQYTVSDETHEPEPSTDISEEEEEEEEEEKVETFGDSTGEFTLGGDKFSSNSIWGLFSRRLMLDVPKTTLNLFPKILYLSGAKRWRVLLSDLTQFRSILGKINES